VVRGSRLKPWNTNPRKVPPQQRALIAASARRNAFEQVVSRRRRIETADQVHRRRLAGARRTHDGDELALRDRQVDAGQRMHGGVPRPVDLGDAAQLDDRRLGSLSFTEILSAPAVTASTITL
jgi:hypothetical protein